MADAYLSSELKTSTTHREKYGALFNWSLQQSAPSYKI